MTKTCGKKCRLIAMFWLNFSFFLVEIIIGYITNSMALVSDSFHMLSDIAALIIAFISIIMSPRKWSKSTFGWARAEILGALINAVFLVALCFSITVEAFKRFVNIEEIRRPQLLLIIGCLGLLVNVIGLFLFYDHSHKITDLNPLRRLKQKGNEELTITEKPHSADQMNMKGVFLHVLSDALGSVIVVISALIYWLTDWKYKYYVDPLLSLILVLLILQSVWPLLKESAMILLQTVPTHIEVETIKERLISEVDGVLSIHEFHIWQLTGNKIIASAHIKCHSLSEYMTIAEKIKQFFHNQGIHSTTIQPEFVNMGDNTFHVCQISCPMTSSTNCAPHTCCGSSKIDENGAKGVRQRNSGTTISDRDADTSKLGDVQSTATIK